MSVYTDLLLLIAIGLGLYVVTSSRINACVRATALQGAALSLLPIALWGIPPPPQLYHVAFIVITSFIVKAVLVPRLLMRTIRKTNIHREVQPYVSLHLSAVIAGGLLAVAFWLSFTLTPPMPMPSALIAPIAFSTILFGFFVVVSRKKAITQVIGYLLLENGIFIYGQALTRDFPFLVELGLLLDLLVGVFVFGITIHHIRRAFDDIDVDAMATLTD